MQKIARKKRIISEPRGSDKVDFEEQMKLFYDAVQAKHDSSIDSDGKSLKSFYKKQPFLPLTKCQEAICFQIKVSTCRHTVHIVWTHSDFFAKIKRNSEVV